MFLSASFSLSLSLFFFASCCCTIDSTSVPCCPHCKCTITEKLTTHQIHSLDFFRRIGLIMTVISLCQYPMYPINLCSFVYFVCMQIVGAFLFFDDFIRVVGASPLGVSMSDKATGLKRRLLINFAVSILFTAELIHPSCPISLD
ncbi:hypothetical protein BYT27DRAFT_6543038 [Phlegmacium glaucopus]|nr:hypothetical protein BYT27DRAFT_6543038 [Phlegmacium glaucopus]